MGKGSSECRKRIALKKERLERYYEAEEKILNSQSYAIGSRTLTRADLGKVQEMIVKLETEIVQLESRGTTKRRAARVVPVD